MSENSTVRNCEQCGADCSNMYIEVDGHPVCDARCLLEYTNQRVAELEAEEEDNRKYELAMEARHALTVFADDNDGVLALRYDPSTQEVSTWGGDEWARSNGLIADLMNNRRFLREDDWQQQLAEMLYVTVEMHVWDTRCKIELAMEFIPTPMEVK